MQNLWYVYRNTKQISVKRHQPPHQENTDDCRGFWVMVLVFEHVTQEFLHGSVSDGPVEEQQLYPLRIHKTQRGEKKKQLSEPIKTNRKQKSTIQIQQGCDKQPAQSISTLLEPLRAESKSDRLRVKANSQDSSSWGQHFNFKTELIKIGFDRVSNAQA